MAEQRVASGRCRVLHRSPVLRRQRPGRPRQDVLFLFCDVVAVVDKVGRGSHLDLRAQHHGVVGGLLQQLLQALTRMGDDPVLLHQPRDRQFAVRQPFRKPPEGFVLARVVVLVGVVPQVADDVQHQRVVGAVAGVEHVHLLLQQAQQFLEVLVLLVPGLDGVCHGILLAASRFTRPAPKESRARFVPVLIRVKARGASRA